MIIIYNNINNMVNVLMALLWYLGQPEKALFGMLQLLTH